MEGYWVGPDEFLITKIEPAELEELMNQADQGSVEVLRFPDRACTERWAKA